MALGRCSLTNKVVYMVAWGYLEGILEAISPLPLCLSGGDQMMPQGIIRNSLGDASRHHQGVKGKYLTYT